MSTADTHSLVTSWLIIARRIGSTAASAFEDIIAEEVERKAVTVTYGLERPVLAERGKSNALVVALSDEKVLLQDIGHALGSLHL